MVKDKRHVIVYTFNSLGDPLIKALMLQYLTEIAKDGSYCFHLITHEQDAFRMSDKDKNLFLSKLDSNNIKWYPINYHNGRWLILKKAYDFLFGFWYCLKIKVRYKPRIIIGFLPLAAGFSAILAQFLRLKLVVYCFEPHSEYMVDFKIWKKNSLKYVLLKKYEKSQLEISSIVIVPTSHTKRIVDQINPYSKKYVLPISVDTDKNIFNEKFRNDFRERNGINSKKVILYLGKFGGIYYSIDTFLSFLNQFSHFKDYHALIISSDSSEILRHIKSMGYDKSFFTVLDFIPYDEIHNYISAADIGVVAVPSLPSQKYRTPVKTGLYLSCGIPYIINKGVAEDDVIAEQKNVGIVLDDLMAIDINWLNEKIINLFADENLSSRCRDIAVKYRSHHMAINVLNEIFQNEYSIG